MAYDPSSQVISAPVEINDVQMALGSSSGDLGTLCQNDSVNQWSKYKPVGKNKIDTTDELNSDKTWKNTATWWKGNDTIIDVPASTVIGNYTLQYPAKWFIKCGMRILGFSSTVDVLGAYNPVSNSCNATNIDDANFVMVKNNYGFVAPVGGNSEPFRQTDFNQYKHNADCRILTDYETSLGIQRVLVKSGSSLPVYAKCHLWTYPSDGGYADTLDIDDLFSSISFTIVCGALSGSSLIPVGVTVEDDGPQTDYYRAKKLNLNISQCWGKTIVGIYCISVAVNGQPYYMPVMQTNSFYYPNNPIVVTSARLRVYKAWYVEQTTNPLPGDMSFGQKQNYGTSFPFNDPAVVKSWTFNTSTGMDRWYLKIEMPKESVTYNVTPNGFRVEFTGQFLDKNNRLQYATYVVQQTSTVEFVIKNAEPTTADWRPSESTIYITSGTGTQTVYLAIYKLFEVMLQKYNGGTIWQIKLMDGNVSQSGEFVVRHEVVYGSVSDTSNRLSVNF